MLYEIRQHRIKAKSTIKVIDKYLFSVISVIGRNNGIATDFCQTSCTLNTDLMLLIMSHEWPFLFILLGIGLMDNKFGVMQLVSECREKETVTLWLHCYNHVYLFVTKHIILSLFSYVILPMYGIW